MEAPAYQEMAKVESTHWWFTGRRSIVRRVLDHFSHNARNQILEVGCGTGGNLEMLLSKGRVTALEMDGVACKHVRERCLPDLHLEQGSFPESIIHIRGSYQIICFFDVLEHIENDVEALKAAGELLATDGYIIITVPAHLWLWSKHDIHLHHKRRYSRQTLDKSVSMAGLRTVYLSYFNMFLLPLLILTRTMDRLVNAKKSSGTGTPPAPINKLLKNIFVLEGKLIPRHSLPIGSSLIAVLKK